MFRFSFFIFVLSLAPQLKADPASAERAMRGYQLSSEKWDLETKLAKTPQQREALMATRPDPSEAASLLWASIAPSLQENWTIPYSAFFLMLTRNLTVLTPGGDSGQRFLKERALVFKSVEQSHLLSPELTPMCLALLESGDSQALPMLEKIAEKNPDQAVQGVAALGTALLLKGLGDDPAIMKKRLSFLRKAIIQSADKSFGNRSVADIATDELYVIRFLSKGRIAPPLSGTDMGDRVVKLSDFKGRIIVLLFWDAKSTETDKIIQLSNQLVEKFQGKEVTVLGITPEPIERIRALQADGSIRWDNLYDPADKLAAEYRISSRPKLFILDRKGEIQFTGSPGSFVELTVDALLTDDKPVR